jgi:hypothetical protein
MISLVYLLSAIESTPAMSDPLPLLKYGAEFWHLHFHASAVEGRQMLEHALVKKIFDSTYMPNLLMVRNPDRFGRRDGPFPQPLYYSSLLGFTNVTEWLWKMGADINAEGGYFGNALQATAYRGHEAMARFLVENGANVNAEGGRFGNALLASTRNGHEAVTRFLVENGANVNED